ncbi:HNH endonuclease signature motif containing protein [Actinomadura geliboluensis]|uniref:HNH endonuclease signature motif containing protein n=1 Tax=Actinomadura geliboluensis TaxID=882440 RepID=UPI0036861F5D
MSAPSVVIGVQREWEGREWFPPGPQLAICLSGGKERLADLTDDELLQVAAAARRQTSWAQARELAAIAELTQRRARAEADGDPDYRILPARDSVTEEVAAALTITSNASATLVHLAEQLTGPLADTGAALEAGRVDLAKARVISDLTDSLPEQVAQRVQDAALEKASTQTTGQLRRRIRRIVQRLAPEAVEERKREAVRHRRLELWDTPSGTADLALCDLAVEDAHAIYNKITAAARGIKTDGDPRPLQNIRADLATQLLQGVELPDAIRALMTQSCTDPRPAPAPALATVTAQGTTTAATSPDVVGVSASAQSRRASVTRDLPPASASADGGFPSAEASMADGASRAHGEPQPTPARLDHADIADATSGPDPVGSRGDPPRERGSDRPPGDRRASGSDGSSGGDAEVSMLADVIGQRLAHVSGRVSSRELPDAVRRAVQRIRHELAGAREAACRGDEEEHGRPGYRPSAAMRREVEARHETCVFPSCNQPSHRCDLDHTVPWRPGTTCRCNLAPLCRRHHRLKQRPDWRLVQVWPGLLIWVSPSGAWFIVRPDRR